MKCSKDGFTLLEVLAAVAVLGILYTVLAGVAMQGLRAEGESKRRLEASLLADELLADLEMALEGGSAPAVGRNESEQDDFLVVVEVAAFEPPASLLETAPPQEGGEESETDGQVFDLSSVRTIRVTVSWLEGESERSAERFTYGYDASLLEGLQIASEPTQ